VQAPSLARERQRLALGVRWWLCLRSVLPASGSRTNCGNAPVVCAPSRREALLFADFHVSIGDAVRDTAPSLDWVLATSIEPPVIAAQTGSAMLQRAIQEESARSTRLAELVACYSSFLLVFRSPLAAATCGAPIYTGASAAPTLGKRALHPRFRHRALPLRARHLRLRRRSQPRDRGCAQMPGGGVSGRRD
jgi:hypothetical protein